MGSLAVGAAHWCPDATCATRTCVAVGHCQKVKGSIVWFPRKALSHPLVLPSLVLE